MPTPMNTILRPSKNQRPHVGPHRKHPTTSNLIYSQEEWEFMSAVQEFKERHGIIYPTWREILGILKGLGYKKAKTIARELGERRERETRQPLDHRQLLGLE